MHALPAAVSPVRRAIAQAGIEDGETAELALSFAMFFCVLAS